MGNILKHEKDIFVADLDEVCSLAEHSDELDFHHDFTDSATEKGYDRVTMLSDYNLSIGNPFMRSKTFHNIVSAEEIPQNIVKNALNILEFGQKCYDEYKQSRLIDKTVSLHAKISANRDF